MADAVKEDQLAAAEDRELLIRRFNESEEGVRIVNYRRAALIGIIFVMGGFVLDRMAYSGLAWEFFQLRVACSAFMGVVMVLLYMPPMARGACTLPTSSCLSVAYSATRSMPMKTM